MTGNFPLVSIVMPSLNQGAFLPAAVESVLAQRYAHLELLVADGGSTDGTLAWLSARQAQDSRLRYFSEPDTGPANALNKAFRQVRGTIIGWLNSDDVYTSDAIDRAIQALMSESRFVMVYGQGEHIDEHGQVLNRYPTQGPEVPVSEFANGCFICQPTVFFKRTLLVLLGPLDETLKTAFDFDYWLRAFMHFAGRIGFVDAVLAQSRLHSSCITTNMRCTVALESMQIVARYLGHAPNHWILSYVNELLAGSAGLDKGDVLENHLEKLMEKASPLMTEADRASLWAKLSSINQIDAEGSQRFFRVDTGLPAWPEKTNCLAAKWHGKRFSQGISLGSFCHAAMTLKNIGFRLFSGPFDWIFSYPEVTAHVLEDDFKLFLDPSQYEPVALEKRVVPDANRCNHRFYRDRFGLQFLFNHHSPDQESDYLHFQRAVNRFRAAMASDIPPLLLMVTQEPIDIDRYQPVLHALDRFGRGYGLLLVRFVEQRQASSSHLEDVVQVVEEHECLLGLELRVNSPTNGLRFSDGVDEEYFASLLRSFDVVRHPGLNLGTRLTCDAFDEDWYVHRHPDVAKAIASGLFSSAWHHYEQHGFHEGREARPLSQPRVGVW